MDKEETLSLLLKGREAWNAWAEAKLAEKSLLEESGQSLALWREESSVDFSGTKIRDSSFLEFVFPANANFSRARFITQSNFTGVIFFGAAEFIEARFSEAPFKDARFLKGADFSKAQFDQSADFAGVKVAEAASFERARFATRANFEQAQFGGYVNFESADFSDAASFNNAHFHEDATFSARFSANASWFNTRFEGAAYFANSTFSGPVQFVGARFVGDAVFVEAQFARTASFRNAEFAGSANFEDTHFQKGARFLLTSFEGETSFRHSKFAAPSTFMNARFDRTADFSAIVAESAFSLENVSFNDVPDFIEAHFLEAPRLDHVRVPTVAELHDTHVALGSDMAARYRALKRLAILGHDHERELQFFADELRSQQSGPWNTRRLFIRLYGMLSDFGRSIIWPLTWWFETTALFIGIYWGLSAAFDVDNAACGRGGSLLSAIYLSLRRGLVFPGFGQGQELEQTFSCLYGTTKIVANGSERVVAMIPDSVAILGLLQTLFSAVLIFLLLLAVRNQFRIK